MSDAGFISKVHNAKTQSEILRIIVENQELLGYDPYYADIRSAILEKASELSQAEWTKEWPEENGRHWFYGWRFGKTERDPELHLAKAGRGISGWNYAVGGSFVYKSQAVGVWANFDEPTLPLELMQEVRHG